MTVNTLEGKETQSLYRLRVSLDVRTAYTIAHSGQDRAGEASLTSRKPCRAKLCTVNSYLGSLSEVSAWLASGEVTAHPRSGKASGCRNTGKAAYKCKERAYVAVYALSAVSSIHSWRSFRDNVHPSRPEQGGRVGVHLLILLALSKLSTLHLCLQPL